MTLTEFLNARLDEDEAEALSVAAPGRPMEAGRYLRWTRTNEALGDHSGSVLAYTVRPVALAHIVRHDPARVLAEVEAKRRIVEAHTPQGPDMHGAVCCPVCVDWTQADVDNLAEMYPCTTLRLLALPYADHADWREEWRP